MIAPVKLFKALGDETRLKIVELLLKGERCVCETTPYLDRTQSTISIQLNKLERLGVLGRQRIGKKVYYKVIDPRIVTILNSIDSSNKSNKRRKHTAPKRYEHETSSCRKRLPNLPAAARDGESSSRTTQD